MPPLNILEDVVKKYPELAIEKETKRLFCPLCSLELHGIQSMEQVT